MIVLEEGVVCCDCALMIANGETSPDVSVEREKLIAEATAGWVLSEGRSEFSWSPCDCCGTHLGGSRHNAAKLGEEHVGSECDETC